MGGSSCSSHLEINTHFYNYYRIILFSYYLLQEKLMKLLSSVLNTFIIKRRFIFNSKGKKKDSYKQCNYFSFKYWNHQLEVHSLVEMNIAGGKITKTSSNVLMCVHYNPTILEFLNSGEFHFSVQISSLRRLYSTTVA